MGLCSMTGFGRGAAPFEQGRLVVELRTVNHRFLDIRARSPRELMAAEPLLEKLVRKAIDRGHCTVHLSCEGPGGGAANVDTEVLGTYLRQLIAVGEDVDLCLADLVPVLSGAPDLYRLPTSADSERIAAAVTAAFEDAAAELIAMRKAEGDAMAEQIRALVEEARGSVDRLVEMSDGFSESLFRRARERIALLLEDTGVEVDSRRLETEAALLADRADITEEITRLRSHCDQMLGLIESGGSVGRRMEFLLQEMGREVNTIGAKAALAELTHEIVAFKAELEKIRELAQNVE
ncbi:MAG: YicC/YloC family endoribonuclease [Polyangia bacterium]